ncbi:MAG: response regulator [Verrucomicrobiales bacterium]|jgi:CheY-like chemotaxis protein|nr:response regulator [Verrucomicrobiales bacterium]MBP9223515.1 response regulator [Verrucomicrobiales bacterium]
MAKKILLVDDEVGFTELLSMNLEKSGAFEVKIENDSTRAVLTAKHFRPDAIILDVVMPGMDGGDVQAAMQNDPELASIPILMLTALVDSTELSEGAVAQAGSQMVLPKPVNLALLLRVLDELLETT